MANAFVHVELNTNDLEKAKTFYSQLFKWRFEDLPMGCVSRWGRPCDKRSQYVGPTL